MLPNGKLCDLKLRGVVLYLRLGDPNRQPRPRMGNVSFACDVVDCAAVVLWRHGYYARSSEQSDEPKVGLLAPSDGGDPPVASGVGCNAGHRC